MDTRDLTRTCAALAVACLACEASGQFAFFNRPSDTIQIGGNTVLGTQATYEAIVMLTGGSAGFVFNEHRSGAEDKQLSAGVSVCSGYGWPNGAPNTLQASLELEPFVWHHVAYSNDGFEERLYVDGNKVAARPSGTNIGDSSAAGSSAAVGANKRNDAATFSPSFAGFIDSLRLSNVALYFGESFAPPTGDLTASPTTILLYNFNEEPGSPTIADLSGNGLIGMVGVGFTGATSPEFTCDIPISCTPDLDGDQLVTAADLSILLGSWGACDPGGACCSADLNGDGAVGSADLGILLGFWGSCSG